MWDRSGPLAVWLMKYIDRIIPKTQEISLHSPTNFVCSSKCKVKRNSYCQLDIFLYFRPLLSCIIVQEKEGKLDRSKQLLLFSAHHEILSDDSQKHSSAWIPFATEQKHLTYCAYWFFLSKKWAHKLLVMYLVGFLKEIYNYFHLRKGIMFEHYASKYSS